METLHLTYHEVLHEIPYRLLIIMSKDKQHQTTGEVMEEVSEEEFFKGRQSKI